MDVVERLIELLIVLGAAKVGAELMTRLRQPAVIGELLIGVIVGGSVLGWVSIAEGDVISLLAQIGVILLLFEVGLETDLGEFTKIGPTALSVASIGVATPFVLGFFGSKALGLGDGSTEVAIFVGAAMTATSVGLTARVLSDLRRLRSREGRTIIAAAVIDDVMGLIILAIVVGLLEGDGSFSFGTLAWVTGKALVFLAAVVVIGRLFIGYYLRFLTWLRVDGTYVVGAFVWAIALGLAADRLAGLDPIVGAFAAGLVVGGSGDERRVFQELRPLIYLFVPVFFLSIGASVDITVFAEPRVLLGGGLIAVLAAAGKLVAGLGVREQGIDRWVIGVGMIPRGEVGLIFAALATGPLAGVVSSEETAIVVLMVVVTTLGAPLVLNRLLAGKPPTDVGSLDEEPLIDPMP